MNYDFSYPAGQRPLVTLEDVRFGYGERVILDGITLTVPRGKVTALMGASGGGKTTVLRLIGGQYRAQSGSLTFDGQEVATLDPAGLVRRAPSHGYVVSVWRIVHRPERV